VSSDVKSYGYNFQSLSCARIDSTTQDPGSLVQSFVDDNALPIKNITFNEVGFGYNATIKSWRYILGYRTAGKCRGVDFISQLTRIG